jgi:ribose transport system permease protein
MSLAIAAGLGRHRHLLALFALTLATWSSAALLVDGFATGANSRNILLQVVALAVIAGGQTVVIIAGGIDLSIPWMTSVAAVLLTYLSGGSDAALLWTIPVIFGVAAVVGIFNGVGVALLKVHPIIMTLASNVILSGAIVLFAGTMPPATPPPAIRWLGQGELLGLPAPFFLLLAVAVAISVLLSFTSFGRRVYAVGASETVSVFSGVRPLGVIVGTYVTSACTAALGGIFLVGYIGISSAGIGDKFLFASVAAVVVGGASILGGSGSYLGTLVGSILLTMINILLTVFSMSAGTVSIFYGLTILISVWLGTLNSGRTR